MSSEHPRQQAHQYSAKEDSGESRRQAGRAETCPSEVIGNLSAAIESALADLCAERACVRADSPSMLLCYMGINPMKLHLIVK